MEVRHRIRGGHTKGVRAVARMVPLVAVPVATSRHRRRRGRRRLQHPPIVWGGEGNKCDLAVPSLLGTVAGAVRRKIVPMASSHLHDASCISSESLRTEGRGPCIYVAPVTQHTNTNKTPCCCWGCICEGTIVCRLNLFHKLGVGSTWSHAAAAAALYNCGWWRLRGVPM